jgi:putative ABC transport system permease protein
VDVVAMVVRQGLRLALIGVAVGLALAPLIGRVAARQLYGVGPIDPLVFGLVGLLWVAVALLASWLPARSATRGQPHVALRWE